MSGAPRVSVILPVHDGERWLSESVESVLGQTLRELELIVVDDGSRDATPEILAGFARRDPRVRVVAHEVNRGLIASLNHGVSLARGELVARQDDDDVSLPERFERQVAWLERHPRVGLLGTDYYRVEETGRELLRRPPRGDVEIRWRLLFGNVWCHASMMLRRELLESEGPELYRLWLHAEDYELWVRLLARSRGATLPEPLVRYRVHSSSVCALNEDLQSEQVDEIARRQLAALLPELADCGPDDLAALRRCRKGRRMDARALTAVPRLLALWEAFADCPDVDRPEVRRLRRMWLERVIACLPLKDLPRLAGRGPLGSLARREPGQVARALAVAWPGRRVRRLRKALR